LQFDALMTVPDAPSWTGRNRSQFRFHRRALQSSISTEAKSGGALLSAAMETREKHTGVRSAVHHRLRGSHVSISTSNSSVQSDHAATARSSRTFGLVFCGFFTVVGCAPLLRGGPLRHWALVIAGAFGIAAMAWPAGLNLANRFWLKFGELLHRVTSPIAITVIYAVGVLLPGLLSRLVGRDSLRLKWQPEAETYWISRSPPGRADAGLKRQF
jgi:hypothetical protein